MDVTVRHAPSFAVATVLYLALSPRRTPLEDAAVTIAGMAATNTAIKPLPSGGSVAVPAAVTAQVQVAPVMAEGIGSVKVTPAIFSAVLTRPASGATTTWMVAASELHGDFVLSSGQRSSVYFDKFRFLTEPSLPGGRATRRPGDDRPSAHDDGCRRRG